MHPFRRKHLTSFLLTVSSDRPLDAQLRAYFKSHRSLGSKDRKDIAEFVYGLTRWSALVGHFAPSDDVDDIIETYTILEKKHFAVEAPPHVEVSFPKWLYEKFESQYGDKTKQLCLLLNEQAPVTLRANPLKTTRAQLMKRLLSFNPKPTEHAPFGITLPKRENLFGDDTFKEGLFEVQDEGSQLIADLVRCKPKDHVLDFCAGSGGKSLAFAHKMEGKGQLYLHDIRKHALVEAKKRMKRAGVQNVQFSTWKDIKKKQMDWVVLDVPCSGTGTFRRNPDMKWKLTPQGLEEIKEKQKNIFAQTFPLCKVEGNIVYMTCSLLHEENEAMVEHFLASYPVALAQKPFVSMPTSGGMDGFFCAVLKKLDN